ncbi:MAG: hypothetical protein M0R17_01515 [Candidatus Omnitrophica bacterium]|jgi:hypothetical protein|nr:hypothetical protein [Candidatus Omnitrophota bacterium]
MKDLDLSFGTNWRRTLILTHQGDLETPVEYISLESSAIPTNPKKFCSLQWEDFRFDYDKRSLLLWPLNDTESTKKLANRLNDKYPGSAKVLILPPAEAHSIESNGLEFE